LRAAVLIVLSVTLVACAGLKPAAPGAGASAPAAKSAAEPTVDPQWRQAYEHALGLMLAATYGWGVPLANLAVRALHPAWGLLGWTGLLVAAVAFQVVPMFQMTPQYPPRMTRWFIASAFAVLLTWSAAAAR